MSIVLNHINKKFLNFNLCDIDLEIQKGEFFVILGPSGSGKTLILEIIAGLIQPDSGKVNGVDHRKIGFIYQDYWLFPHLDVFENIAYGLKIRNVVKEEINLKVRKAAEKLEIMPLLGREIDHLSGGEKQRVAIARAVAISPELYLFDEPTSSLDRNLRLKTRNIFLDLHRDRSATFIHVTHDFEEALSLADRLAILMNGKIIQWGKPEDLFNNPKNKDVAEFLGYRNVFGGVIKDNILQTGGISITVPLRKADFAYIAIRSDDIILSRNRIDSSARNSFLGKVENVLKKPSVIDVVLNIGVVLVIEITRKSLEEMKIKTGDNLWVTFKVSSIKVFKHD